MKFSYQLRKCWIYERPMCLVFIHPFFFFLRHLFGFAISNLAASFSRTTVELQHSDVSWLRVGSGKESVGRIWYTRLFARDLLQITWWYLVRVCHFHFLGHLQVNADVPQFSYCFSSSNVSDPPWHSPTPHLCRTVQGWLRIRGHLHCLRGDGSACGEGADCTSKCANVCEIERIFRVSRIKSYMVVFRHYPCVPGGNHSIWHHAFSSLNWKPAKIDKICLLLLICCH